MKRLLLILLLGCSQSLYAESGGWITRDGKPVPNSDSMKSIDGFGGSLVVTPDPDWEAKWNTPPETAPSFRTASKVRYGENLTVLTFFINPKTNEAGEIDVVCDIKITRPDGSQSIGAKEIECAKGKLEGDPHNVRLSSAVIKFVGEKGDLPGTWKIEVNLTDRNRKVVVPLKTRFDLVETKPGTGFQSQDDVSKWMMFYYQKPEPERVPEAMEYMSESALLDNENALAPTFGFLAGVFHDNPQRLDGWIKQLDSLKEPHLGVVMLGLWYANLPDSKKRVYAFLEDHPGLKQQFGYLYKGSPMPVEEIPLERGPWVLDALWGNFMATGNKAPVQRIMTTLPWIDVKGDVNRLLIGGAARWSLTSNAKQHERVMQFCEEDVRTQSKEVSAKLREVIANAKKEPESGLKKKAAQPM